MAIRILSSENVKGQLNVKDTQDTVFDSGLSVTRSLTTQTGYINIVGGAFNFNAPASISTKFRSNGNELIRIESDGDFWLRQVGKKLYFQNSAGAAPYIKNSGEDASTTPYGRNLEFYTDSYKRIEIDYAGTTTFDSGSNNVVAVFKSTDTETQVNFVDSTGFASIRSRNDFRFYVGGSSLIRAMDIADDGNVGIGTASPETDLMIYDTVNEDPAEPGFATTGMFALNRSGQATLSMGVGANNSFWMSNVNRAFTGPNYYNISLNPLGGRVGVGTTTPAQKLHVIGKTISSVDLTVGNNSSGAVRYSGQNGYYSFITRSNYNDWSLSLLGTDGDASTDPIGTQLMTVNYSGKVGIGVTNPQGKLDVAADSSTASAIKTLVLGGGTGVNGNGQYIQFRSSANVTLGSQIAGTRVAAGAASDLRFSTTDSGSVVRERVRIDSSGDVIIGGTVVENPASINRVLEIAAASPVGLILNDTRDPYPMTIANEGAVLNFKYNTTNMMTLPPSGDVQIPTDSASLQLRSSGSASYTSIRRNAANQLIVANTAGNQVFGIGNSGELAITNGASYSGTETYSNAWNAGYQTLILGSQLSPDSVYIITINVGSGFGTPPYYASAVFTIITAPSTNSTGGGFDNIAPTATHVSSNAYWKYRLSCISPGRNGVEAWLVNGPTNPPSTPTIYVKATKIM